MIHLAVGSNLLARGLNDKINWVTLETGKLQVTEFKKPMMVLIHKTWCGACKALKPQFAASARIEELSSRFVMVNLEDDEEPADEAYKADGAYIPRIFFTDLMGKVDHDIHNEGGNPKYKYYYSNPESIVRSMERTLKLYPSNEKLEL